ncbi:PREDICTED: zeatin O-glucosyltransferase-like [Nicotiana attenuata]|uniref:zeatin O-glucosyltransferase-like n=1 Tax=Nicotiana attenuata TaxID=49451 RepID=UPI0009048C4F|nr:PREDICTED: zeatin O-glucosyltransferase-like [Nicotiana attenuata]
MAAPNSNNIAVVMVPFPEYGHLTPLLHLSRIISSYDIPVHYVSVGARNQELKLRLQGWNLDQFPNIQFHDIIGNFEVEEDNLSYVSFFDLLGEPLCEICRTISRTCRRVVIIHDSLVLQVVQGVNSIPNVETYIFHAISAFTVYSLIHHIFTDDNNNNNNNNNDMNNLFLTLQAHIPSIQSCYPQEMLEFMNIMPDWTLKSGEIFNTCRDIEGPYLDALAKQSEKPVWGLGPFNPIHVHDNEYSASHRILSHKCVEWLDKQLKNSVIYVSFGTASTFSPEQLIELALGLERSEQKFIWVLREADKKRELFYNRRSEN